MKYHYQFVSRTTVRIELIPEDKKDTALVDMLGQLDENNEQLAELFRNGLEAYHPKAVSTKIKFMNFPKVALCSYETVNQEITSVA